MPHSQGYSILTLFPCCLLLLNLILHSSRVKKRKKKNSQQKITYFFYLCLSVSVVFVISLHLCRSVFIHRSVQSLPVSLCTTYPPRHFYQSFLCSCICLYAPPPPPSFIIMFSVLFSVSKLFVPFSVSFLSLLGPCVEGGQCCLSTLCGQFQVLH